MHGRRDELHDGTVASLHCRAMSEDDSIEMNHRCSQLLMPSADDQRAIISSLESGDAEHSRCVYTVSQAWYDRWRAYVGLDQPVRQRTDAGHQATSEGSESEDSAVRRGPSSEKTTTVDENAPAAVATALSSRRRRMQPLTFLVCEN